MSHDVACLRPEADFLDAGVTPPDSLSIRYLDPSDPDLAATLATVRAVVMPAVGPALDAALFEGSAAKLVQVTGAGVDRLDQAAMERLGIAVANVAGGSNDALAGYAVGTAITLLRRFAWADAEIRLGRYETVRAEMVAARLPGLEGLLVGVIGLGTIGTAVAEAFHRMGARIAWFDPAVERSAAAEAMSAIELGLDELLAQSDVVTLHVPLLPATRDLIGERELSVMKPEAVLINAARGGIVDERALANSLKAGAIGGAAIDVYSDEPPGSDNPLLALEGDAARRILFTPHIGGITHQAWATLFQAAWDNVVRVLVDGDPPLNRVY